MKILTHMPRIFPRLGTLAMRTPTGMPTITANAMPRAKERSEIAAAALNFAVGMIVIPAATTPENGGTMVDSLARPTISQTTNHANSENRIGIFLPNRIISGHGARIIGVLEYWNGGVLGFPEAQYSSSLRLPSRHHSNSSYIQLQDLPYLVNGIEIILIPADLVGISSVAVDVGLDDLRYRSRPRR